MSYMNWTFSYIFLCGLKIPPVETKKRFMKSCEICFFTCELQISTDLNMLKKKTTSHVNWKFASLHMHSQKDKEEWWRGTSRLSSFSYFSDVCGETKVDRYPSGHPDDHCDGAGLYLETHQRAFKNGEQRICMYQMKALGSLSDTNMLWEMSNIWCNGSYPQIASHYFEFWCRPTALLAILILALIPMYPLA